MNEKQLADAVTALQKIANELTQLREAVERAVGGPRR